MLSYGAAPCLQEPNTVVVYEMLLHCLLLWRMRWSTLWLHSSCWGSRGRLLGVRHALEPRQGRFNPNDMQKGGIGALTARTHPMQLAQWLRLFALWGPGSRILPERVTRWSRDGLLCRVYLCVSLGLLQPFFLLVALLLCRSALRSAQAKGDGVGHGVDASPLRCTEYQCPPHICHARSCIAFAQPMGPSDHSTSPNAWVAAAASRHLCRV